MKPITHKNIAAILQQHLYTAFKEDDWMNYNEYDFEDGTTALFNAIQNLPNFKYVKSGITKMAIFFKNTDFVVKIPFIGNAEEVFVHPGERLDGFAERDWDYCELEVALYHYAKEAHVHPLFVPTRFLTTIADYPIYIQPKTTIFSDTDKSYKSIYSPERLEETEESYRSHRMSDTRSIDLTWSTDVINYHGEEMFHRFCNFLTEEDLGYDYHKSNLGYIGNRPVVIDYCDYHY